MKRKLLIVALLASMVAMFALSGCGLLGKSAKTSPSYTATLSKSFITGSYDGTELLVVELEVTNTSDMVFYSSLASADATATLDGKKLTTAYMPSDNPNAIEPEDISTGDTGIVQMAFELTADTGTVNLVVNATTIDYSSAVEVLNEDIDLSTVEVIVSEASFDLEVNDIIVTDDGEGKNLLVLQMTFTNNSDEATSFGSAVEMELFQNNTALKSGYLPYNHPLDDNDLSSNTYNDVKSGASNQVQVVYVLNDTQNPVEFKCIDRLSYDNATILDTTIEVKDATTSAAAA